MKLTPIRVRGKKGQPRPDKKRFDKRSVDADGNTAQPVSKRAKKHHERDGDSSMKKSFSRLSQLPQEVLERIFIASGNLSLPFVNHELHHRLSSDSVKYQLVGAAFGLTWNAYYGIDKLEVSSYDGWQWDAERIEGDPHFQSEVLACSWATTPMLMSSLEFWIRQNSRGRAYFTVPQMEKERLLRPPKPGTLWDRAYIVNSSDTSASTMTMREKLDFDLDHFRRHILGTMTRSRAHYAPHPPGISGDRLRALFGTHLELHPGTEIPAVLLSGPFESEKGGIEPGVEKMRRLTWLVRAGACLQDDQTWETTRTGFQQILRLITDAGTETPGDEPSGGQHQGRRPPERLELAAGLLTLFDFLGVFDAQWPRYIVQTSLARVSALIPASAPASARETLLGTLAAKLRGVLGRQGGRVDVRHIGLGWARSDRFKPPRRHEREAAFLDVCRQRAKLFLCAPGGTVETHTPSSPVGGAADGWPGPVAHEPWSDFGLD